MYYPTTVPQGLVWLLLGLIGGGTWPALRQAIKSVDFEIFNVGFILSMSGTGLCLLSLLSLPPTRNPPPPPFGPGDWDGLWGALAYESGHNAVPLWLATCAGACVSTSNVLLAAAMPLAGLTRALPVFNGVAIVVGVGANYALEGNDRPGSLVAGVALILLAIFLTFRSRGAKPAPPRACVAAAADDERRAAAAPNDDAPRGLLSAHNLQDLVEGAAPAMALDRARGLLSSHNLQDLVHAKAPSRETLDSLLELATETGAAAKPPMPPPREETPILLAPPPRKAAGDGDVMRGLAMCAAAGAVDGCWSSLTTAAKLRGIDNYVTASYFMFGLLLPLAVVEAALLAFDRPNHLRKLAKLTTNQFLVSLACGSLNVWGVVTYFMATVQLSAAVAFAIFLSTPLVSISLGVCAFRELDDQPPGTRALVGLIVMLYVLAIASLASNALLQ